MCTDTMFREVMTAKNKQLRDVSDRTYYAGVVETK
jgi:hypothetical protein